MPQTEDQDRISLEVAIAKIQKDIEYILLALEKQQQDIDTFNAFVSRWKGAALVLMGLGGAATWVVDHLIKLIPFYDK